MKIPGAGIQRAQKRAVVVQACGYKVLHALAGFPAAVHAQQARFDQHAALHFRERPPDHDIEHAVLVLERNEGHAARGAWALPHGYQAGRAYRPAIEQIA